MYTAHYNNTLILKNACHASLNAFYKDRLKHKDKKSKKKNIQNINMKIKKPI